MWLASTLIAASLLGDIVTLRKVKNDAYRVFVYLRTNDFEINVTLLFASQWHTILKMWLCSVSFTSVIVQRKIHWIRSHQNPCLVDAHLLFVVENILICFFFCFFGFKRHAPKFTHANGPKEKEVKLNRFAWWVVWKLQIIIDWFHNSALKKMSVR